MLKKEQVYREILYNTIEKNNRSLTQAELSKKLGISLSTVNNAINALRSINAISVKKMNFRVIDVKKIIYYWASIRSMEKDVVLKARINMPTVAIEKEMPDSVVFTCYSGYKFKFKTAEADYTEVYVYGNPEEIMKRFKHSIIKGPANLIVLKKTNEEIYGKTATMANLFVDIWNAKEWYAKEFLTALEEKLKRFY